MISREESILQFLDELQSVQLHGVLITLQDECVCEGYWKPFRQEMPHRLFSVSKTAVSMAVGILATRGLLSLSDPVCRYFPELLPGEPSPLLLETTVEDLLTMRTVYAASTYRPLLDTDWTRTWFVSEPSHLPGTLFNYDTSGSQVLCALVEKLTGQTILSFLEDSLFRPLGMQGEKRWLQDQTGTSQGGTGLIMTLRDLSLLTRFCASDGRGIIDPAYMAKARSKCSDTSMRPAFEERFGYGYQIWQTRNGFSLYGMAGQMGICIPDRGITLCTLGDTLMDASGVQPIYDAFFRRLSSLDTQPSSPSYAERLHARLESLSLPLLTASDGAPSCLRVQLENSPFVFQELTVFEDHLSMSGPQGSWELPFAQDAWVPGAFPVTSTPCFTHAAWETSTVFTLRLELTGDWTGGLRLRLVRKGTRASLQITSAIWELVSGWNGTAWGTCVDN